jgi:hypothetical protein
MLREKACDHLCIPMTESVCGGCKVYSVWYLCTDLSTHVDNTNDVASYPRASKMISCVYQEMQELKTRVKESERIFDGPTFDAIIKFIVRCKNRSVLPDAPSDSQPLLSDLVSSPIEISEFEDRLAVEEQYVEILETAASCTTVGLAELQATASFAILDFVRSR